MTNYTPQYTWGSSKYRDNLWGQVVGLRPSRRAGRLFMAFQVYIDDSYDWDNDVFVLAGCIADIQSWDKFSEEWERLLPYGTRNNSDEFHFKMAEMAINEERMSRVPWFFRTIQDHVLGFVDVAVSPSTYANALKRVLGTNDKKVWGMMSNPFHFAFRTLMDTFHNERLLMPEIIPLSESVDFYFDEQKEKGQVFQIWDDYVSSLPGDLKAMYGNTPRFEDDTEFLPLQAADFWAWWVRHWNIEGHPEKAISLDFGSFQASNHKKLLRLHIEPKPEDEIVEMLTRHLTEIGYLQGS